MIRLRRASAIVALSLLASATTAYAECAWVLWSQKSTFARGQTNLTTDPANLTGAFEAHAECDRAANFQATSLHLAMSKLGGAKNSGVTRLEYGGWRAFFERENEVGSTDFKCFPDTVDPRGPKAK